MEQEPAVFSCKRFFKARSMTFSFIPKEMSKHLEEKLSEMEGRQTHVNDSYFMS